MTHYTVALLFNRDYSHILLLHPKRPAWQVGKLNGPGGKVEGNETPAEGMSREVQEETALVIPPSAWNNSGNEVFEDKTIHFLTTCYGGDMEDATQQTDEAIEWFPVESLPDNLIDNLYGFIDQAILKKDH